MDLQSDFLLNFGTNRFHHFLGEGSIDFFFVVVNSNIWLLEMLHVPKHFDWVIDCHKEVVELVWSFDVRHDHVENEWIQHSHPVNESASRGLLHNLLPVRDNLKPGIEEEDLLQLLRVENLRGHEIETVVDDSFSHEVVTSLVTFIDGL